MLKFIFKSKQGLNLLTADLNLFLINVTSFVKFDEMRFARYNSALMVFGLYLLGILDVHGVW